MLERGAGPNTYDYGCNTTTEQAFVPGHLSRLPLGPGQKVAFVPGPTASQVSGGGQGPFVPGGATNQDKRGSPAGSASHWTRDKSHILSRAQRQPGQMA